MQKIEGECGREGATGGTPEMSDLVLTKLCAEAMGITHSWGSRDCVWLGVGAWDLESSTRYQPLHDDVQAMQLMKRLRLACSHHAQPPDEVWEVVSPTGHRAASIDLNHALVEAAAKSQAAKGVRGIDGSTSRSHSPESL